MDKPSKWDRPVLLVIPDQIDGEPGGLNSFLGNWLAKYIQKRRNTIRFLLPANDTQGIFTDEELIYSARCSFLCSPEGWGSDSVYRSLRADFDRPLRGSLKSRFNRVAILRKWFFQQPQTCVFDVEKITEQGGEVPSAVENKILSDLFDRNDFRNFVLVRAKDSDFIGSVMDDLIEPPPPNMGDAMPFLGETKLYEFILNIVSTGEIVLNVAGTWIGRRPEDTSPEEALRYIRSKAFRTGQEMRQIQLGLPGAVGGGTVTVQPVPVTKKESTIPPIHPPQPIPLTVINDPKIILPEIKTKKSTEPTTPLNLIGCFETWGISSSQTIESARIEFSGLTAQQIKQILQRVPSTFKANLDISFKEGGQE
jgi:hypothetical protein